VKVSIAAVLHTLLLKLAKIRNEFSRKWFWQIPLFCDVWGDNCRKVGQKYLESFEMWCWRRMEKIS
jgi:hypothetical protein